MQPFYYFSPNLVTGDELKAGYGFARSLAEKNGVELTICVNNIGTDQSVDRIFSTANANKLKRYEKVFDKGVTVQLKTPSGWKDYQDYGVVLGLHPGPQAIEKFKGRATINELVVIAEVPDDGTCDHLVKWSADSGAKALLREENA